MRKAIFILFTVLIASCTPKQRLAGLLKRHPELAKTDTLFKRDTIWTKSIQADTLFRTQITKDTVIIRENNLTVKYYNDGKTTYLKGTCDTIRIIKEVPVIVTQIDVAPETFWERAWRKAKDFIMILLLGAILVLIYLQRKKLPV